ncbi:Arc family DNA-binding protein [Clostridium perfringens]
MSKDILKYTLTIPNELLNKIKKEAQTKGMSLNEYILLVLNQNLN